MGNYRFRLSDMMPNAWFYKLKDMSRTKNMHSSSQTSKKKPSSATSQKPHHSQPRQSYYYTIETTTQRDKHYNSPTNTKASDTHFPDPPRRSSKKKPKRKTVYRPSPRRTKTSFAPADCNCQASLNSAWIEAEPIQARNSSDSSTESSAELDFIRCSSTDFESDAIDARRSATGLASWSSSCSCRLSSSATDIIFDMNEKSYSRKLETTDDSSAVSELDLPPILTKPGKFNDALEEAVRYQSSSELEEIHTRGSFSIRIIKEESVKSRKNSSTSPIPRKSISQSTGVKVRAKSPKLASKKLQGHGRKSISSNKLSNSLQKKTVSESFAVVKASFDPEKDFRDSMMEMIIENNIRASKDLEELLACYLTLNLDEYHDLIIKAFEQVWFTLPAINNCR